MIIRAIIVFTGVIVLLSLIMCLPSMGLIWAVNLLANKIIIPFTFWHILAVGILMGITYHLIRGKR